MTSDLTLVVTAHDETAVCGPTMESADLAVTAARARGCIVETVVGLGAPTEATSAYFRQPVFDHWQRRVLDERDLGRVRNVLAGECRSRHVAFLDAGDLCSENWLAEGIAALDAAAGRRERAIAHPELQVVFDGETVVQLNIPADSPLFTPHYLYARPYYGALCIAPRAAHLELPYVGRDVREGPSCPDLQWTIETLAAGWRHVVVRDTIVFERRRDLPSATRGSDREPIVRSLPAMAIDRVRDLGRSGRAGEGGLS